MARQQLLTQDDPVEFHCVLDESALRRTVGGPEVMGHQLGHLLTVAALPNVTLQVLPFAVGQHPGMEGSFVLLRFPDHADPDTVYVTMATGGVFQEKVDELSRYESIFNRLTQLALTPEDSAAFVAGIAVEKEQDS
jgi:hypothetical protein